MTTKSDYMQNILKISFTALIAVLLVACGSKAAKDSKAELGDKKVKLEKLKKQQDELNKQVADLEKEIAKLDPSSATKPKLVVYSVIGADSFSHFIDLQGKIDATNVAMVAPQGQGGVVRAVLVKQGQQVRKGQLILKLDDAVARQGVVAAQQQISGIKAQLDQAQSIYERQQNLWKQNIGTEIQVLNAKTNVEALQSQLRGAEANVRLAQEQANMSNVTAGISGTIDVVNVKVGEFFSAASAGNPGTGIRIVNTGELKITAQVPENYLGRVKEGSVVEVVLPESGNKTFVTKISVVGKLIYDDTRSFYIEAKIPAGNDYRPNQIASVKIRDYATSNAITIPVNTLQNDEKGKYVMVAVKEGDKLVARKKQVMVGELYGEKLEVKSGLLAGDQVIIEGFQNLYEGQLITTTVQ
jgi:membrane fusion protein (multidrug efflux system)